MTLDEMVKEALARQVVGYTFIGAEGEAAKYNLSVTETFMFIQDFNSRLYWSPVVTCLWDSVIVGVTK